MNVSKSKFMMISSKKKTPNLSIFINDEPLEQCESYKYLGVFIDQSLSWKPHISHICKKISKACGALSKTRHIIGIETLKSIYHALVNSYLRYGILSWGNASHSVIQPLKTLINRAVRIMSFAPFGRLDTKPIFQHLKLLNVEETFLLETSKFIYKNKNGLLPISSIAHHFDRPISNSNRTLRLRSHPTVAPYNLLSSFAKKSIQVRASQIWQDIPPTIQNYPLFSTFKRIYKHYLIENDPSPS